jgi:hypothetical protein
MRLSPGFLSLFIKLIALIVLIAVVCVTHSAIAQAPAKSAGGTEAFNPRDLSGVWWVADPGPEKLMARGRHGDANKCATCHISNHTVPEPPLTPWAKEHLLLPDAMAEGTGHPSAQASAQTSGRTSAHASGEASSAGGASMGAAQRNECDPLGVPAQFWYTQLAPFEFVATPERIFQFFETRREWRAIWLNRGHPASLHPSYMGDSVGKWDGNTLVVDTIGYNGKELIEPVGVGHLMSDAFHLVERWQRVSRDKIELDATYYDPKAWGDKAWGGLKMEFVIQPGMQTEESYCSPEDNAKFEEQFMEPAAKPRE